MYSLSDHIKLCRPLNDAQIMRLMQILGKGCRRQTKEKLERRLKFAHIQRNQSIYDDLIVYPVVSMAEVEGHGYADYIADIGRIRKLLIG